MTGIPLFCRRDQASVRSEPVLTYARARLLTVETMLRVVDDLSGGMMAAHWGKTRQKGISPKTDANTR